MADRVRYVCECGSENVCCDAAARWNIGRQQFEVSGLHDGWSCDDCERQDAKVTEVIIPEDTVLRPHKDKGIHELRDMAENASPVMLRAIGDELGYRAVPKAKRLANEIAAKLAQLETV